MICVEKKAKEYKTDIKTLENSVKKWSRELFLDEIGKASRECYNVFNELQMNIAKIKKDKAQKEKYDMRCYKETYNFLAFLENDTNPDLYVLLVNNVKPFGILLKHYSKYCSIMEAKYNIELDSEKSLRYKKKL